MHKMYKNFCTVFPLGTYTLVSANPTLLKEAGQSPSGIECQKETGGKKRLRSGQEDISLL